MLLLLLVGWERGMASPLPEATALRTISVIVPARNEEKNLGELVRSLAEIDYPADKFQVILVDDHSTDGTLGEMQRLAASLRNGRVMVSGKEGKKSALAAAVGVASGEIVVTTDADCRVPRLLLHNINACFATGQTKLVIGPVRLNPADDIFGKCQSLELASLIGSACATAGLGAPVLCNGANLAFDRAAFLTVGGYEGNLDVSSGDDEFLMRKIQDAFGGISIRFMNSADAIVDTKPERGLVSFLRQRIRWASKWKHNTQGLAKAGALFVFLLQLSWIAIIVKLIHSPNTVLIYLALTKVLLEGQFLWRVAGFLKVRFSFLIFLLLQIIYSPYVLFVGLVSNFVTVSWKDRPVR